MLRCDGVYVERKDEYSSNIRFYESGLVITSTIDIEKKREDFLSSFSEDGEYLGQGEFHSEDGSISFTTTEKIPFNNRTLILHYNGTVFDDHLEFDVINEENGRSFKSRFEFEQFDA